MAALTNTLHAAKVAQLHDDERGELIARRLMQATIAVVLVTVVVMLAGAHL